MNDITQKKYDVLHIFANLTRYPPIQNVAQRESQPQRITCNHHCCSDPHENGSLSHIVFPEGDNKKKKDIRRGFVCNNNYEKTTMNNKPVLMSSSSSYNSITFLTSSNANKHINIFKQHWTRNKIKMVQTIAAVITILVLTFCLLFQPGASPREENHPSWSSGGVYRSNVNENNLMGYPSSPSLASRFGIKIKDEIPSIDNIEQEDLFISVKTSQKFHQKRLDLVLKTWFQLARDQTWFFTDQHDPELEEETNGHLKVTECSSSHSRQALCCKMAAEFDAFLESGKNPLSYNIMQRRYKESINGIRCFMKIWWFCHFDDDNYVNVPALVRKLKQYDHNKDWYLGKPSIPEPLEIMDREHDNHRLSFWFATGGAGFCLSRSLASKMAPIAGGGRFETVGDKIRLPDDVTMGYIAHLLDTKLTRVEEFHSHLEPQRLLEFAEDGSEVEFETFQNQISFSYSKYGDEMNVVGIEEGAFTEDEDPTRFKSLHCKLFPNFNWCPKRRLQYNL